MMLHCKSAVAALQIYRTSESGTGRTAMISISRSMMLAAGLLALSMGGAVAQGSMQFWWGLLRRQGDCFIAVR